MKTTTKNWILTTTAKFPFVEFDRFIDDTDDKLIEVFGWIKREKEIDRMKKDVVIAKSLETLFDMTEQVAYNQALEDVREKLRKDFIVLEFNLKTKEVYCIATSSAKYSEQISKILGEKHISCQSIKDL